MAGPNSWPTAPPPSVLTSPQGYPRPDPGSVYSSPFTPIQPPLTPRAAPAPVVTPSAELSTNYRPSLAKSPFMFFPPPDQADAEIRELADIAQASKDAGAAAAERSAEQEVERVGAEARRQLDETAKESGLRPIVVDGKALRTTVGRPLYLSEKGEVVSEKTITFRHPSINGGQFTVAPSIYGGRRLGDSDVIRTLVENGGKDPDTGEKLPGFETKEEAAAYARSRSKALLGKEERAEVNRIRSINKADRKRALAAEQRKYEADNPYWDRQGQRLTSGWKQVQRGYLTDQGKKEFDRLDLFDQIDAVESDEAYMELLKDASTAAKQEAYDYRTSSPERREALREAAQERLASDVGDVVQLGGEIGEIPRSPAADAMIQRLNDGDWDGGFEAFMTDPMSVMGQVAVESLPHAAPGIAAAVATRRPVASVGAGTAATEFMSSIVEGLQKEGVDLKDPKAITAAFANDELMSKVRERARIRATVIAGAEMATMGVAGGSIARGLVASPVGGAGGEAGAQVASGEELQAGDIAAEAIGELPQGAIEAAVTKLSNRERAPAPPVQSEPEPPPAAPEPAPEPPRAPPTPEPEAAPAPPPPEAGPEEPAPPPSFPEPPTQDYAPKVGDEVEVDSFDLDAPEKGRVTDVIEYEDGTPPDVVIANDEGTEVYRGPIDEALITPAGQPVPAPEGRVAPPVPESVAPTPDLPEGRLPQTDGSDVFVTENDQVYFRGPDGEMRVRAIYGVGEGLEVPSGPTLFDVDGSLQKILGRLRHFDNDVPVVLEKKRTRYHIRYRPEFSDEWVKAPETVKLSEEPSVGARPVLSMEQDGGISVAHVLPRIQSKGAAEIIFAGTPEREGGTDAAIPSPEADTFDAQSSAGVNLSILSTPVAREAVVRVRDKAAEILDGLGLSGKLDLKVSRVLHLEGGKGPPIAVGAVSRGRRLARPALHLAVRAMEAFGASTERVVSHEIIHALKELKAFSKAEWAAMSAASKKYWIEDYNIDQRYKDGDEAQRIEEGIAEAYANWAIGRDVRGVRPRNLIDRAFRRAQKILGAFDDAVEQAAADARGVDPEVERIFMEIASGAKGGPIEARPGQLSTLPEVTTNDVVAGVINTVIPAPEAQALNAVLEKGEAAAESDAAPSALINDGLVEVMAMSPTAKQAAKAVQDFGTQLADDIHSKNDPRISVDEGKQRNDAKLGPLEILRTPSTVFKQWPEIHRVVMNSIRAEISQSKWIRRLFEDYAKIRKQMGNEDRKVAITAALLQYDADGVEPTYESLVESGLSPKEARAALAVRKLLEKVARIVDQHRRSMMPQVRERKRKVWARMQDLASSHRVMGNDDFRRLYRRRYTLRKKLKNGDPGSEAILEELAMIEQRLGEIRFADPEYQQKFEALRAEHDILEERLSQTSVRRREGYFPHIFFGSWRLYVQTGVDEDGNPTREEITSEHGFYDSRADALRAAEEYLRNNPDASLQIEPKQFSWPMTSEGTTVSDGAYLRYQLNLSKELDEWAQGIADAAGLSADEVREMIEQGKIGRGAVKTRNRRRTFRGALKRRGSEGFSQDIDKVMRNHIGAAIRYVVMDKLKYESINVMEKMKLGVYTRTTQERPVLQGLLERYMRDVNGQKQSFEETLDTLLDFMGRRPALAFMGAAAAGGAIGASLTSSPLFAVAMGGYAGYRLYNALQHGGDFKTRALTGSILGDVAHLKLGAVLNLGSGLVNVTQTLLNTYPVLKEKYTAVGLVRAMRALSPFVSADPDSPRFHPDAQLLQRADIKTRFRHTESMPGMFQEESRLARASLFIFNAAETINRSVAFLGAYARAEDQGKSPGQAFREAEGVMLRTQFHYGNSNKPEILRGTVGRIPMQFKNFIIQQLTFTLGLRGGEIARFAASMTMVAGLLGLPFLQLFDWLGELLDQGSLIDWMKDWYLRQMTDEGYVPQEVAAMMARGLPGIFTDITGRAGQGDKFLPTRFDDLKGPAISTIQNLGDMSSRGATLADLLRTLSPGAGGWAKSLEAAANGKDIREAYTKEFWDAVGDGQATFTNPRQKGLPEYDATNMELVMKAAGLRPIYEAKVQDLRDIQRGMDERHTDKTKKYLAEVVRGYRANDNQRIRGAIEDAREAGHPLTERMVKRAIRDSRLSRAQRDEKRGKRLNREALAAIRRALEKQRALETQ